jgi:membrane associated rhomboid family serine protease
LPAIAIWDGAYWGVLRGVFVHLALWHLAFNMYWLWVLGSRLELAIGHIWFLVFFLTAGFVSSSFQLAVSDSTGIVIQKDLQSAWAYFNRSSVYDALDEPDRAELDRKKAREIDSTIDSRA